MVLRPICALSFANWILRCFLCLIAGKQKKPVVIERNLLSSAYLTFSSAFPRFSPTDLPVFIARVFSVLVSNMTVCLSV